MRKWNLPSLRGIAGFSEPRPTMHLLVVSAFVRAGVHPGQSGDASHAGASESAVITLNLGYLLTPSGRLQIAWTPFHKPTSCATHTTTTNSHLLTDNTKRENWYDYSHWRHPTTLTDNYGPVNISRPCRDKVCLDLAIVISLSEENLRVYSVPDFSARRLDREELFLGTR